MWGKLRRRSTVVLAIAGAATIAVGVGVATGAIPDSAGVIHACYNTGLNPSGALRVIDTSAGVTCSKNEKALSWNQTGPQGPAGPQGVPGPQGIPGPQGPAGTSGAAHGYSANDGTLLDAFTDGNGNFPTDDVVATGSLPAGSYLVWADIDAARSPDGDYCAFVAPGVQQLVPDGVFDNVAPNKTAEISDAVTLPANNSGLLVKCGSYGPGPGDDFVAATITALRIDSLN